MLETPASTPAAADSSEAPAAGPVAKPVRAHIDHVARVGGPPSILVMGWVSTAEVPPIVLSGPTGVVRIEPEWSLRHARADVSEYLGRGTDDRPGFLACYALPPSGRIADLLTLEVDDEGVSYVVSRSIDGQLSVDARAQAAGLWPQWRGEASEQFGDELPVALMALLAQPIGALSDLVRLHLDHIADLGSGRFLCDGWCIEVAPGTTRLLLVDDLTGGRDELSAGWTRTDRSDLTDLMTHLGLHGAEVGFVNFVDLHVDTLLPSEPKPGENHPMTLFALARDGRIASFEKPAVPVRHIADTARAVLGTFRSGALRSWNVLDEQAGPALMHAFDRLLPPARVLTDRRFGPAPEAPRASIIITMHATLDLWRVQMARMAMDPELAQAELIVVVDDPQLGETAARIASELYEVFGLPFRMVCLALTIGYGRAVEFGVSLAKGRYVVLLDADVLPSASGWLSALTAQLDADENLGAIGPRLIREDGTIDSEGLACRPHPRLPGVERIVPIGRGRPSTGSADAVRDVDAISAACLVTRRGLFRNIGGFAGQYLYGHHEDYLYCTRVRSEGHAIRIDTAVRLFHLGGYGRQKLPTRESWMADAEWQAKVELYNLWRHTLERTALKPLNS